MKKRILALVLCLALVLGMAAPVYAEGTPPAPGGVEVTTASDVPVEDPVEEPSAAPSEEPVKEPGEPSPEPSPAPSPTPVEPSPTPGGEPAEPSPTPSEEPAVTESPAPAEEPADLAPQIEGALEEGDSGVTVRVAAPEGAFPVGTELFITPVNAVAAIDMGGERGVMDGIKASVADALVEEPVESRGTAAFDIAFLYEGEALQPNEGYPVSVIFEVETDSVLLAEADQLQVFHMQETGEPDAPVAQPVTEAIPVDPEADVQVLEVSAERFSIYVVSGIASAKPTLSLKIGDKIAINGCLVPEVVNLPSPNPIVSYRWSRLDGTGIKEEALSSEHAVTNGVNIAVDRGGVDDIDRTMRTYKVEALGGKDKVLASASFDVPYGNEVINGSFEQPESKGVSFFQNGTANLFWRTTANDGQIEVGRPGSSDATQQYNTGTAAEGKQFAELNANNAGTLYQDVLTTPGASLNWLLSHRGRGEPNKGSQPGKTDTMYVIIAAAGSASKIKTQDDVKKLIPATVANGKTYTETITTDGKETVRITYTIWELKHDNCNWYSAGDAYQVPAGQYLTRFFFAAGPTADTRSSVGNLIDQISFSEKLPYTIQYYKDDALLHTEAGRVAPGTTVAATPPNGFSDLVLDHAMLNFSVYTGGAAIKVVAGPYVLKLYYVSTGITVTKEVKGLAKDLTSDQLQALLGGYQATFTLEADGEVVATATVGVNADTQTGTALFKTGGDEKFVPVQNTEYTVVEMPCSPILGYRYSSTTINEAAGDSYTFNTGNNQAVTVAAVNTYEELPKSGNLTITKTIDGNQSPEQSFIFEVTGHDFKMQVVLGPEDFKNGTASVTIQNLPAGTYTVTEDAAWSWQYKCTSGASQNVTIDGSPQEVSFTNTRNGSNWFGATVKVDNVFDAVTSTQRSMEPAALPSEAGSEDDEEV